MTTPLPTAFAKDWTEQQVSHEIDLFLRHRSADVEEITRWINHLNRLNIMKSTVELVRDGRAVATWDATQEDWLFQRSDRIPAPDPTPSP